MAIINPSFEQIEKALSLVEPSNMITDARYAMTKDGTAFATVREGFNLHVGINTIKANRQIFVYGGLENGTNASVQHILVNIDMYPKQNITNGGYIPVHPREIPEIFKNMETTIYEV